MPDSPTLPNSPVDRQARDDDTRQPRAGARFDRPEAPAPFGSRIATLLARVPVSPGRLAVGGGGAVLLAVAAVWLLRPPTPAIESTLPRASAVQAARTDAEGRSSAAATSTSAVSSAVVVDAAGAVRRPGLYRLRSGARVDDLVRAAGGLAAGADRSRLNLAETLADGQRVYVPKVGEVAPLPVGPTGGSGGGDGQSTASTGPSASGPSSAPSAEPVDLNTATADQLDTLPGVGPATAAAILAYRTDHGPFHSVDELLDVPGIGEAKLAALRPKVRV